MAFAWFFGNPCPDLTQRWIPRLLKTAVVGLGAGLSVDTLLRTTSEGLLFVTISIVFTLLVGISLGKLFRSDRDTALLVSAGTAICGGSAIAAIAGVIRARPTAISAALATVFLLNSIALLLFPPIGKALHLTETQFGIWSALAIHDTSSVLGAAVQFGPMATQVATALKLTRTLWIIPLSFIVALFIARPPQHRISQPWFILGFILMAIVMTYLPVFWPVLRPILSPVSGAIETSARRLLVTTLFLIGSAINKTSLTEPGLRPFCHGLALWLVVSVGSLLFLTLTQDSR